MTKKTTVRCLRSPGGRGLWAGIVLAGIAGCATAPPVDGQGLPRFSRYTNAAQLDFLLSRYNEVATEAARAGDVALRERACLGYERTVFDLESLRRYPLALRMGSDTAAFVALRDELPQAVVRHPQAAACQPAQAPATAAPVADATQAPEGAPPVAQAPVVQAPVARTVESSERELLAQLRGALPPPPPPGVSIEEQPPVAPPALAPQAEATLASLTESAVPTIRLRARFHEFGRCVQLVEASDRYPTLVGSCYGGAADEAPRRGQARLLPWLLTAWRSRHGEPFAEGVVALTNFASRDNPVTDGPRPTR